MVATLVGVGPWRAGVTGRLGTELDTNARRAVLGSGGLNTPSEVVTDLSARYTLQLEGRARLSRTLTLEGSYVVGGKQFLSESAQDLVAQSAWLRSGFEWGAWSLSASARGRSSRIRNGSRDYDLGTANLELRFTEGPLSFGVQPGVSIFRFGPESRFDYESFEIGGSAYWRVSSNLHLSVLGQFQGRSYAGNGWVVGIPVDPSTQTAILTFCDDPGALLEAGIRCEGRLRRDEEIRAIFEVGYLGDFYLRGRYVFRRQRSNSELENVDRHRLSGLATFALPAELDLTLQLGLQFNDSVSFTDRRFLVEADENQNILQVELRRPLNSTLAVEVRYGLFANQFLDAAAEFLRQTVYIGLSANTSAAKD